MHVPDVFLPTQPEDSKKEKENGTAPGDVNGEEGAEDTNVGEENITAPGDVNREEGNEDTNMEQDNGTEPVLHKTAPPEIEKYDALKYYEWALSDKATKQMAERLINSQKHHVLYSEKWTTASNELAAIEEHISMADMCGGKYLSLTAVIYWSTHTHDPTSLRNS